MSIPKSFLIAARNVFKIRNEIISGFGACCADVSLNDCKEEFRGYADELLNFGHGRHFPEIFEPQFEYRGRRVVKNNRYPDGIRQFIQSDLDAAYDEAMSIIERSDACGIKIIGFQDQDYPMKLQNISERPVVLYAKGNFSVLDESYGVAVIGTRKPTEKGAECARMIAEHLGKKRFNVISGLALGCDGIAHEAALTAGGITTAILADGLDAESVYPKRHSKLAFRISEEGGLLLSEYAVGQKCSPHSLVQRDRWQAQLSVMVMPVQTSKTGGTMHAATWAYKHRIPIAAAYLSEYRNSWADDENRLGYENLISSFGAKPIERLSDIDNFLSTLGYSPEHQNC